MGVFFSLIPVDYAIFIIRGSCLFFSDKNQITENDDNNRAGAPCCCVVICLVIRLVFSLVPCLVDYGHTRRVTRFKR